MFCENLRRLLRRTPACTMAFALILPVGPLTGRNAYADDKLPTGTELMEAFIKNTGGKAAYERLKNRVSNMKLEMAGGAMSMKLTRYAAEPAKMYTRMESEQMGTMEQGYDGTTAWMLHPMMGAQLAPELQKKMQAREAFFHMPLKWKEVYKEATCDSLTDFEGEPCYKVIMATAEGDKETWYFSKDTGLQRGVETEIDSPMGKLPLKALFAEYKEVDGVLYPHKITQSFSGQEVSLLVESIQVNADLPADRFNLPEAVVKLVAEAKAAAETAAKGGEGSPDGAPAKEGAPGGDAKPTAETKPTPPTPDAPKKPEVPKEDKP